MSRRRAAGSSITSSSSSPRAGRVRPRDGLQRELRLAALAADDPAYYLKRQAAYAFLGIVALAVLSRTDFRRLRYLVPPLLLTSFARSSRCSSSGLR